jgi:ribosomal protein S18 acetylase RimI-like enzyme
VIDQVRVGAATPERWREVRALRLAALADTPDAFTATLADERDEPEAFWRQRLQRTEITTLLARVGDEHGGSRPAGLVAVGRSHDDPDLAGLYAVWVAPWGRGRGVGDALLETAIARAAAAGYPRIVLDVGDHNLAAIRLYDRHGFTPTGRTHALPPPRQHITEHERARDLTHVGHGGRSASHGG